MHLIPRAKMGAGASAATMPARALPGSFHSQSQRFRAGRRLASRSLMNATGGFDSQLGALRPSSRASSWRRSAGTRPSGADSPDLSSFKRHDYPMAARSTPESRRDLSTAMSRWSKRRSDAPEVSRKLTRLFVFPGMAHAQRLRCLRCGDQLTRERCCAGQMICSLMQRGKTVETRVISPYPGGATHIGTGSPPVTSDFVCDGTAQCAAQCRELRHPRLPRLTSSRMTVEPLG
jgi:hypothetical protein